MEKEKLDKILADHGDWVGSNGKKGIKANLRGADLVAANLQAAQLQEANLHGANLQQANLHEVGLLEADLRGADLQGADLVEAYLFEASLLHANLADVNLSQAVLYKANLTEVDLKDADFTGAGIGQTMLIGLDLRNVRGLESVFHSSGSYIDCSTLEKSKGRIPETFLRGCGFSDIDIQYTKLYNPSLSRKAITDITYLIHRLRAGHPIQFYSCFISYNSKDAEFATKIHDSLQDSGVRCWFAPEDMQGGKKVRSQIDDAIRISDKLILVLSEENMNSKWVAHEIKRARRREKEKNVQMLFPISLVKFKEIEKWELFDDNDVTNLAAEVRKYFIPDFQDWQNPKQFQPVFDRLLKDLRADGKAVQ